MVMEDIGNYSSNIGNYSSNKNDAMNIVNNLRNIRDEANNASSLAYAKSSRSMKPEFAEMYGDPSKRPQFGAQKANELEEKYKQGLVQIRKKYEDVQRPDYGKLIENRYRYAQGKFEKFLYGQIDNIREGDKHAWDKMVKGDVSRGLYSDVSEIGDYGWPSISFERTVYETMREIFKLADAYYSGDIEELNYLLGLTSDDDF